jgi:cytochrome b561
MSASLSNPPPRYGATAKALHWLIVAMLIVQFTLAWTMPDIHRGTQPETLIDLHLSFGASVLGVAIIRLLWRVRSPVALISEGVPAWQLRAAQITHVLLYVLLLVIPVLGWANASSRGWTVSLFGLVTLPSIMAKGSPLGHELGDVHTLCAYALLALVGLHVLAALYHHFRLRDPVLRRMLPGRD